MLPKSEQYRRKAAALERQPDQEEARRAGYASNCGCKVLQSAARGAAMVIVGGVLGIPVSLT